MNLTDRGSHFEFGENWRDYAITVDRTRIDAAIAAVKKLFPDGLKEKTFLDIGCGSGLHSLAALSLGAKLVVAIDIDENSVSTTRDILKKFAPNSNWTADVLSIFDATPDKLGKFDIVYSWGVLHHTGDMWRAIRDAAAFVRPSGLFALAIYSATKSDSFWKAEKRFYSHAPRPIQFITRQVFKGILLARMSAVGTNPLSFVRNYSKTRGMNFSHDAHDWLGGYPYETATAQEMHDKVCAMGFNEVRSFPLPYSRGLFGSGCHEFVYQKASAKCADLSENFDY